MADDNTKNFLKSVDSVVEETERAFEQRDQIAEVYNQWAVDQGADPDELNAAVLEDILVENGVIPAADDHTVNIGWGRQIHAPGRFEIQLFYDIAANTIANELEQHGFSTTVRPFTLEKDPWMNYNTEKRSYTYPTMMVGGEVTDYHPAEAQNSRRLDAHEVALTEQERATLEHFFETDMDDVETLPELHDAMDPDGLIDGGRDDLPDFRGVYNAVLDRLAESQVYPEHILVEPGTTDAIADDQAVKLRRVDLYDDDERDELGVPESRVRGEDTAVYAKNHGGDVITRDLEEGVDDEWLPAMEGYSFVTLPATVLPNQVYLLRDGIPATGKFAPDEALDLEQRLVDEAGLQTYPIADTGEPSVEGGTPVMPEAAVDQLLDTKLAKRVSGPGHYDFDTAAVSVYPTAQQRRVIDDRREQIYQEAGVYDGGEIDLPTAAKALTEAMYEVALDPAVQEMPDDVDRR